jgi:hypothetical protein
MKKLFLSVATLMLIGFTNAQNVSLVDQAGVNTGTVTQTSFGSFANYSELNQVLFNNADVVQLGLNESYIDQFGTNQADVRQDGGDGFWTGFVGVQISDIDQVGNNAADVDQTGDANYSAIDQFNLGLGAANMAIVQQGQGSPDSYGNGSYINQLNYKNYAEVNQDGNFNMSYSEQTSGMGGPVFVPYFQENFVYQTGWSNLAEVTQHGKFNYSMEVQNSDTFLGSDPFTNEAYVAQTGKYNWSELYQDDGLFTPANNTATINQTNLVNGPGNYSSKTQVGANSITVTQTNL